MSVDRASRVRYKLRKVSKPGSIRLSVFRSLRHISVQAIDDSCGKTLLSATSLSKEFPKDVSSKSVSAAVWVGEKLAEELKKKKFDNVYFDRGSYAYHGRVKALADAVRKSGLDF